MTTYERLRVGTAQADCHSAWYTINFLVGKFPHPKKKARQSLGEFSTGAERHLPWTVPWWKSTTDLRSQCLGDIVLRSQ